MAHMDDFLAKQYDKGARKLNVSQVLDGSVPFTKWQEEIKSKLRELMGRFPKDEGGPVFSQMEQEEPFSFGTRSRILIRSEEGLNTPSYLLQPFQMRDDTPVILCLHGHGFGSTDITGVRQEESYQKKFAVSVCQNGMVALAPELAGFGSLRLQENMIPGKDEDSSCIRLSMGLISCGRTMAGVRIQQCIQALNIIQRLFPDHPIGVMGISGGGMIATQISVLDERVQASVISGYACTFRDSILSIYHCVDNYLPNMLDWFEMEDLLCAIAPRHMLWESATGDPIFPHEATLRVEKTVRKCYEKLGIKDRFDIDVFQGGHEISGAKSYEFLKTRLQKE